MRAKSQGHGQDRESAALRSERSSAGLEGGVGRDPLGELPSNGPRKGSGNRRGAVIGNGYSNGRSNSHRRGHFNGHRSSRSTSSTDWRPQNRTKRSLDAEHTTSEAEEKPQYQHHRHEQHPQEEVKDEELDEEPFEALPVPQAITRCPVIDWEKYHVVGSGLEKLHRQEVLDPSVRAGDPVGSSSRYGERGVAMARFSPWKDVVD